MPSTIGNPLSWGARNIGAGARNLGQAAAHAGGDGVRALPELRTLTLGDLKAALRAGLADFLAFRSDVMMACLFYPVIGALLIWATAQGLRIQESTGLKGRNIRDVCRPVGAGSL